MSSSRSWFWAGVTLATATCSALVYYYTTKRRRTNRTHTHRLARHQSPQTYSHSHHPFDYNNNTTISPNTLSSFDETDERIIQEHAIRTAEIARQKVEQSSDMILLLFAIVFMAIAVFICIVYVLISDVSNPFESPFFPSLMWISVGMFSASGVHLAERNFISRRAGRSNGSLSYLNPLERRDSTNIEQSIRRLSLSPQNNTSMNNITSSSPISSDVSSYQDSRNGNGNGNNNGFNGTNHQLQSPRQNEEFLNDNEQESEEESNSPRCPFGFGKKKKTQ